MNGVPSSNMKAKPIAQKKTPQMQVSAMPSTRMLTDSRSRAKPASSMTKPTCMPKTRKAAISVQAVLIALTDAIGSGAAGAALWASASSGRNQRVISGEHQPEADELAEEQEADVAPDHRILPARSQPCSPEFAARRTYRGSPRQKVRKGVARLAGDRELERVLLDVVGGDRRESEVVALSGPDPDHPLDRLDEDLAVAYRAGARGGEDRPRWSARHRARNRPSRPSPSRETRARRWCLGGRSRVSRSPPWPLTRVIVMPVTPARKSASLTAGRRSGRMMQLISFIAQAPEAWRP